MAIASLEDLTTLANMIDRSALAPKTLGSGENSVAKIAIALQLGAEIGLTPMASMQNIAVINGKPSIYGDAGVALVRGSGFVESWVEYWTLEGERHEHCPPMTRDNAPDSLTCWVEIEREGQGKVTGSFSVGDAKRAGLWNKSGPWKEYWRRMLHWRATSWACRDGFADVLCGTPFVEEQRDVPAEVPHTVTETARASIRMDDLAPKAMPADASGREDRDPKAGTRKGAGDGASGGPASDPTTDSEAPRGKIPASAPGDTAEPEPDTGPSPPIEGEGSATFEPLATKAQTDAIGEALTTKPHAQKLVLDTLARCRVKSAKMLSEDQAAELLGAIEAGIGA